MSYKSIDVKCQDCELVWNELVERELENTAKFTCPNCGGLGKKTVSAPTVLKATYPDGTKRDGFRDMKEALKLESEMYNKHYDKRKEYQDEIKKLKGEKK